MENNYSDGDKMKVISFTRGERTHSVIIKDLKKNNSTAFSIKSTMSLAQLREKLINVINKFSGGE